MKLKYMILGEKAAVGMARAAVFQNKNAPDLGLEFTAY